MNQSIHAFISLFIAASGLSLVQAQEKRAMTFDEMVSWERNGQLGTYFRTTNLERRKMGLLQDGALARRCHRFSL